MKGWEGRWEGAFWVVVLGCEADECEVVVRGLICAKVKV